MSDRGRKCLPQHRPEVDFPRDPSKRPRYNLPRPIELLAGSRVRDSYRSDDERAGFGGAAQGYRRDDAYIHDGANSFEPTNRPVRANDQHRPSTIGSNHSQTTPPQAPRGLRQVSVTDIDGKTPPAARGVNKTPLGQRAFAHHQRSPATSNNALQWFQMQQSSDGNKFKGFAIPSATKDVRQPDYDVSEPVDWINPHIVREAKQPSSIGSAEAVAPSEELTRLEQDLAGLKQSGQSFVEGLQHVTAALDNVVVLIREYEKNIQQIHRQLDEERERRRRVEIELGHERNRKQIAQLPSEGSLEGDPRRGSGHRSQR